MSAERLGITLANATHFPLRPNTPILHLPSLHMFFFDRRRSKAWGPGAYLFLFFSPLLHRQEWCTVVICLKSTTSRCLCSYVWRVSLCNRCVWRGRSSSDSRVTPPGPSWATANLSRRQRRGQASAKTFTKPSKAPSSTSGLWTWLIGERICTFGAIIAEWRSIPRGNRR